MNMLPGDEGWAEQELAETLGKLEQLQLAMEASSKLMKACDGENATAADCGEILALMADYLYLRNLDIESVAHEVGSRVTLSTDTE